MAAGAEATRCREVGRKSKTENMTNCLGAEGGLAASGGSSWGRGSAPSQTFLQEPRLTQEYWGKPWKGHCAGSGTMGQSTQPCSLNKKKKDANFCRGRAQGKGSGEMSLQLLEGNSPSPHTFF